MLERSIVHNSDGNGTFHFAVKGRAQTGVHPPFVGKLRASLITVISDKPRETSPRTYTTKHGTVAKSHPESTITRTSLAAVFACPLAHSEPFLRCSIAANCDEKRERCVCPIQSASGRKPISGSSKVWLADLP